MPSHLKSFALLLPGLLLATAAQAACYTVLDARGVVVSQTSTPPVDMSRPLHQTVPARYGRGAHMVFGVAEPNCGPVADPWSGAATPRPALRPARADRG